MRTALLIALLLGATLASSQCYPDRHSTSRSDAWLSCSMTTSPRTDLGRTHWIQYDLGVAKDIKSIHLWNANIPAYPGAAISKLRVDVSMDGINWSHVRDYDLPMPEGGSTYEGEELQIDGLPQGRYVLLTALENYGYVCSGIGEVRFGVEALSTSTDDVYAQLDITLSPNPASDYLRIELPDEFSPHRMEIYDLGGRLMLSTDYTERLSLLDWTEGQYTLALSDDQGTVTRPFTIIKSN